jgi:hypothetical protein
LIQLALAATGVTYHAKLIARAASAFRMNYLGLDALLHLMAGAEVNCPAAPPGHTPGGGFLGRNQIVDTSIGGLTLKEQHNFTLPSPAELRPVLLLLH